MLFKIIFIFRIVNSLHQYFICFLDTSNSSTSKSINDQFFVDLNDLSNSLVVSLNNLTNNYPVITSICHSYSIDRLISQLNITVFYYSKINSYSNNLTNVSIISAGINTIIGFTRQLQLDTKVLENLIILFNKSMSTNDDLNSLINNPKKILESKK